MPIRIAVTGRQGQIARALAEAGPALNVQIINLGRPQLDLAVPEAVGTRVEGRKTRHRRQYRGLYCCRSGRTGAGDRGGDQRSRGRCSITSANYPTPAPLPANSRLNCSKIAGVHGIELPSWRDSLGICLERLVQKNDSEV